VYILYGGDFTRSTLVQWLLDEGRIAYEFRRIDIMKGENRSADFLSVNPAGLVPVLVTPEGDALYEVLALMLYLADRHGLTELAPAVSDPDRGSFLSALFDVAGHIQPEMKRFHFPHRFSPRPEDNRTIQDQARSHVFSCLETVNARLAKAGPHVLGPRFSLVDVCLCFWIAYLDREAVCMRFSSIAALYGLVRSRPGARPYLEHTEQSAEAYADMMRRNPGGVIA
jgi:glutathione S-transferase